jgi:hypothetical protein
LGVGFLIPWAGREYYSIAWPDDEARRYVPEQLNDLGIEVLEDEPDESLLGPATMEAEEEIIAEPSEAAAIREYLEKHGVDTPNKVVVKAFADSEIAITSAQVTAAKKALAS